MTVTIRPRLDLDLRTLAVILVRVYETDGYPVEGVSNPEAWLHHDREIQSWSAVKDDIPVGQITLAQAGEQDDAAHVWREVTGGDIDQLVIPARLFVDPSHRRTGAGRLLMETALQHARARNSAVAFDVMQKDTPAIRLYERLGAVRIGEIEHSLDGGHVEPALIYSFPNSR